MSLPPREYDKELQHHGVMGMHWGVRKPEPVSVPQRHKAVVHPDHPMDKPPAYSLSDVELRRRLNRVQMERMYSQLAVDIATQEAGKAYTKKFLATYKTANDAYNIYNSPMVKQIRTILKPVAKTAGSVVARNILHLPLG